MVYYFTSNVVDPAAFIYVGKDKVESQPKDTTQVDKVGANTFYLDEDLIKYGWEEDVWFHVDNLSSAHVYVRLRDGESWDQIPQDLVIDCVQLTKANSIEGNKKDNVTVIYTPWSNLKKDGGMAVGQVGFKDQKKVKRVHVEQRLNPIVNRLNKTKVEKFPDLRQEREDRNKELRNRDRAAQQQRQKEEKRVEQERKKKAYERDHAYDFLNDEEVIAESSNQDRGSDFEDDFM